MADYIKRDDVIEYVLGLTDRIYDANLIPYDLRTYAKDEKIRQINIFLPAAAVRENVRGHWIFNNNYFNPNCRCSACGTTWGTDLRDDHFCKNCGAEMKRKEETE